MTLLITANHYMISNGAGVLTVPVEELAEFNRKLTQFYDTGESSSFKKYLYDTCVLGMERSSIPPESSKRKSFAERQRDSGTELGR